MRLGTIVAMLLFPFAGWAGLCQPIRGELRAYETKLIRVRLPDGRRAIVRIEGVPRGQRTALAKTVGRSVQVCVDRRALRILAKDGSADPDWI